MNRFARYGLVVLLLMAFSTAMAQDGNRTHATQTVKFGVIRSMSSPNALILGGTKTITITPLASGNHRSFRSSFSSISLRSPVLSARLVEKTLHPASVGTKAVLVTITD